MSPVFTVHTWQNPQGKALRYAHISPNAQAPQKSPIVYVPGLGGSVKSAVEFLKSFARQGHPVYSLDAQGWGLNDDLPCYPNPVQYLADFKGFVADLQQQGALQGANASILMGISLGGILASIYASQTPHPFGRLVLLAPAFKPHPKTFSLQYRLKAYGLALTRGFKAKLVMPYGIEHLTQNPQAHADPSLQTRLSVPVLYMLFVDRLCAKALKALPQIDIPVALVAPQADVVCCPQFMRQAFKALKHPKSQLISPPGVFHDIPREPEPVLAPLCHDLLQWLDLTGT